MRRQFGTAIAHGFGRSVGVKIIGVALALVVQVILARLLGPAQYGIYTLALSWVGLFALIARLGLDISVVRFIPEYRAQGRWSSMRGLLHVCVLAVGGAGVLLGISFVLVVRYFPGSFKSEPTSVGFSTGLLIPLVAISFLAQGILRGLRLVVRAELLESIARPLILLMLVSVFTVSVHQPTSADALRANAVGTIAVVVLGGIWATRAIGTEVWKTTPLFDLPRWSNAAIPFMFLGGLNLLLDQFDVLIIGAFRGPEEVAIYAAGARIASQVVFLLTAADVVIAPIISEYAAGRRIHELRRTLTQLSRAAFAFAMLTSFVFIAFGHTILGVYGEQFKAGFVPMAILIGAKLVNVFAGSVGMVLNMSGYQRVTVGIIAASAALNLALSLLLTPRFGLVGAAGATALSIVTWNTAMVLFARHALGVDTTPLGMQPVMASGNND